MEYSDEVNYIVSLLESPMTVEVIKKLSDYSSIEEKDALYYMDKYHEILAYQVRFSKYGMDNRYISDVKQSIINSIISNKYQKIKKLVV